MSEELIEKYLYNWPYFDPAKDTHWEKVNDRSYLRHLDENKKELASDSRWPGFFPSPICFVTTTDGEVTALEKVVGASIVNRFPYIIAMSLCIEPLSARHYARNRFIEILEKGGVVAVQYFEPGAHIDAVMNSISSIPDDRIETRIANSNLPTHRAMTNDAAVFNDAYMVYEARLVKPGRDFTGNPIYEQNFTDLGSHRIYYLEIQAIQLREDIANGEVTDLLAFAPALDSNE